MLLMVSASDPVEVVTYENSALASSVGGPQSGYEGSWQPSGRIALRKTYLVKPSRFDDEDIRLTLSALSSFTVEALFSRRSDSSNWLTWNADGKTLSSANYQVPVELGKRANDQNVIVLVRTPNPMLRNLIKNEAVNQEDLVTPNSDGLQNMPLGIGRNGYFQIKGKELWSWYVINQNHKDSVDIPFFVNPRSECLGVLPIKLGSKLKYQGLTIELARLFHENLADGGSIDKGFLKVDKSKEGWSMLAIPSYAPSKAKQKWPYKETVRDYGAYPSGTLPNTVTAWDGEVPYTEWDGIGVWWVGDSVDCYFGNVAMKPQHN